MSSYAVEFSCWAMAQIRGIFSYIAENDLNSAHKMVDKLEAKACLLAESPFMGTELPQSEYPFLPIGYRKLIVKPFILYYRVIEQTVIITHIIHSRRNQKNAVIG